MDLQRFTALCDAYGSDLARWPEAERAPAATLAHGDRTAAEALAHARVLDEMLAECRPYAPSMALRDRILAAAPRPRTRASFDWLMKAGLGAGLAAAGLAGVLVGSVLTGAADADGAPALAALEASPEATAFGAPPETLEG